jgi:hypothetical protein
VSSIILGGTASRIVLFFAVTGTPLTNVGGTTQQDVRQKTSPEMDRLKLYRPWDFTETYAKTPFYPQGGSDAGVYQRTGRGNSIVNRFHSHGAVGDFEGLLVITWIQEKAYKSACSATNSRAAYCKRANSKAMRCCFVLISRSEGMKMQLRNVTRVSAVGKIVSDEYIASEGSPEVLMLRVDATRRP